MSLRRVLRAAKCASLVGCHETAVTDHIGHEDGGQPAFHSDLRRFGSSSLRQVVGLCREPGNGRVSATKRTSRLMIPPPAVEMARGTRPVAQEAKADPLHCLPCATTQFRLYESQNCLSGEMRIRSA